MNSENQPVLHVGQPNLGDRQIFDNLVDGIFERRWFTNSGVVEKEFEDALCQYLGVRNCIAVCNATVGLQLACQALELTGEVIVPGYTFVATPHAVGWEGLKPVFADVFLDDHTVCPESVESLISDKTSAIVGVHVWGHPCRTDELQRVASEHGLHLMYDSAHAFGCAHQGSMIGNFGQCEVFSFHATKFFNTFEGGAISTNDDQLAAKLRLMKNFGFAGMDNVVHLGTNAKMTEISAAMGLSVFARLDEILANNQRNYQAYQSLLSDIPGLRFYSYDHLEKTNWQYIVIEIDESDFGCSRDEVFEFLIHHNVRARRYFYPGCHRMQPYASVNGEARSLPNTEKLCDQVLCLPTGPINLSDVERVCSLISQCGRKSSSKQDSTTVTD